MKATWSNLEEAARFHWVHWYGKGPFRVLEQAKLSGVDCCHLHNGERDMGWFAQNRLQLQSSNGRRAA